jgi:hypothetical protein
MKWLDAVLPRAESRHVGPTSDILNLLSYGGNTYPLYGNTSWGPQKAEAIGPEFAGLVDGALKADGVISAIEQTRFMVFAEARFLFQRLIGGRPGDLWGDRSLRILERPWVGGTTGDLLSRMLLDADFAGNSYWTLAGDELVRLRPDWVEILLAERVTPGGDRVGYQKVGFNYYQDGVTTKKPVMFAANEVCHFAPYPDPLANYRGMSWLTPVVREIQSDIAATQHKLKFFENAATPNVHVGFAEKMNADQLRAFKEAMDDGHAGSANAYKTLYTAGGADVTVLGADMRQMDFKATQGAGETRLAAAGGVHPVIVGLSEGMQGSSLNAGNYQAAKRVFIDKTIRPLWRNVAGSLETLVPPPGDSRLWYDDRDVPFLLDDIQDRANVQQTEAITIRNLVDAGYTPDTVVAAVMNEDMSLLQHSGLFSVQLNPAGAGEPDADDAEDDAEEMPRSAPLIADGAIRVEVHPPAVEVDARTMPGAVNASMATNPPEAVEGVLERATQQMADVLTGVLDDRAERDAAERAAFAAQDEARANHWFEMSRQVVESIDGMRAEASRPRRKRVETDEIGRITAIEEEVI